MSVPAKAQAGAATQRQSPQQPLQPPQQPPPQPPIVVELDGSLIRSSLLWEAVAVFLKQRSLQAFTLLFWRLRGRAEFARRLFAAVAPDAATLPYDRQLLALLGAKAAKGRTLVLASDSPHAAAVAQHLALFDSVLDISPGRRPEQLAHAMQGRPFDYIGQAHGAPALWAQCRVAYQVGRTAAAQADTDHDHIKPVGEARGGWGRPLLKAMRPRQWMKNLLVFVPMLAGHMLTPAALAQSALAFVAFCLCASSAYLLNDTLDARDDRAHATKRQRPIAAGTLPIAVALGASALLAAAALALCARFDALLTLSVLIYFLSTVTYSIYLKRLLMVDIVTLAILFSLRILGGAASTRIEPSFWLLAFSFFLFLSLALLKRHSELFNLHRQGKKNTNGRGYTTADKAPIGMMGINSAFISVLIFSLYFNSENVIRLYRHPAFLFAIVPLLVFWLGRLWTLSFRGEVNEDPVLYVSRDPVSLVVVGLCAGLAIAASL
ncbi:UbiA family prenyltransferase [Rugamonas sp. CCM 8940]|uniref:UbiA family prenyltransferase n=1 Tax=Rugamonas sp. CCM 8940 TaxID=2765359 RepID=UPI0018F44A44|nr:UbiA family prenyltransferase [Rugamonas sp. CCM 8940]MBJ7310735.1 UbiA family prenyltransferase [Rugamonas sp. CCM 8940]